MMRSLPRLFAVMFAFGLSCMLVPGCDDATGSRAEIERLQQANHELAQELQDVRERLRTLERRLGDGPQAERPSERARVPQTDRRVIPELGAELIQAILDDDELLAIALVEEGAPVDTSNDQGMSALHAAVRSSMLELTEVLLENGADVHATIPVNGQTPMHWVSRIGSQDRPHAREIADLLLEYGADINAADAAGTRPIDFALHLEHVEWLQFLVSRGANVN